MPSTVNGIGTWYYGALLEAEPENTNLKYPLARITSDPQAAERLLNEAVTGSSPSAYGYHGLAYQRLVEGGFREAYELAVRARELAPENELFSYVEEHALLALRRFDVLLERNEARLAENPLDGETAAQLVRLHVAAGDLGRAEEVIETFLQEGGAQNADMWRTYLQGVYQLGAGNWKDFRESLDASAEPRDQYQKALVRGDHAGGIEALTESGEQTALDHMLVYLAAVRAKDHNLAEPQLDAAVEMLSVSSPEEKTLAACIAGEKPPSAALALALEPKTKAVALAVLASRYGDGRVRQLAWKLNYDLSFEKHFLDRIGF